MPGQPREFGPYRLVRRLGVGGMAETFEATRHGDGGFEQRVCLKRVLPAFGEDEEFVSRFQREAMLAARLRHTNIVGVVDAGKVDGAHYMALELVDGVDLRSLLKSSPGERLSPDAVALIALDVAYALEHAHETLVHRDISPSNILLSRSGEAKLADFGIAKAIDDAKVTASRTAKGKIPYMAPEHMRGESVDGRADLFSLGVVLFEAVSGVRPFDGTHDVETMQKILDDDRLTLADVAPETPLALRNIIERLIEVDRAQRFPSAAALLDALAAVEPPPSVRRALAGTIESHRGGPGARLHVRASEEERDTELSRVPVGPSRHPRPTVPVTQTRRRPWALFLAATIATATLAYAVASAPTPGATAARGTETEANTVADRGADANTDAVTSAGADPVTDADTGAGADPVGGADTDTGDETTPARATARPARGWLHVVVQPWGNVWIDGKYYDRAPVKARLERGRHVVEAGRELPSQRRVVRVQPGARKEIEITLREE